jgi:hypothetical protein
MKWLSIPEASISQNLKKALLNTLFRLIIPTIIFSSLFYLPKLYFNSNVLSAEGYIYDVLGGISFWFTSAMAVCNILMLLTITIGARTMKIFSIVAVVAFTVSITSKKFFPAPFPWYWRTGLAAMALMTIGGWGYHFSELIIKHKAALSIISIIGYIVFLCYNMSFGGAHYAMLSVNFNLSGLILTIFGIAFIFTASCRWIPNISFLQFIGRNSIVFYFLSGVIPAGLSACHILHSLNPLIVSAIAVSIGSIVTWGVTKYLPFLIDIRNRFI